MGTLAIDEVVETVREWIARAFEELEKQAQTVVDQ